MFMRVPSSSMLSSTSNCREIWFLGACLLLGAILRIWGIDSRSLWDDEACTVRRIDQENVWAVVQNVKESPFPPFYYLVLRAIQQDESVTVVSLRLVSLMAGLLAIPVTYFGVSSLGGRVMARWAALLTSTSAFHVHYCQDAKMYSLVWLLVLCGNLGFLNLVWSPKVRWGWVIMYLVGMTLLPWTSYVGIVGHGVQGVWLVVLVWNQWSHIRRRLATLGLLFGFSSLPFVIWWAPIAIEASTYRHGIGWIPPVRNLQASLIGFWETTASFLTGVQMAGTDAHAIAYRSIWVILTVAVVGVAFLGKLGGGNSCGQDVPDRKLLRSLFLLWWCMPLVGCLLFSLICYPLFGIPRFLSGAAPGLLLLIAGFAAEGPASRARFLGGIVVALNFASIGWSHTSYVRVPMFEIVDQIEQRVLQIPQEDVGEPPVLFVTKSPNCQIREITLEVTLRMRYPSAQVIWIHWGQYRQIRGSTPILVLHESSGARNSMSDTSHLSSLPEWSCIFRQEVFEHPLTAMADPSYGRQIEVWSWTPPAGL